MRSPWRWTNSPLSPVGPGCWSWSIWLELHRGDLAAACSWATRAATLLQQTAYALGAARLRAFRAAAQRPLTSRALRALDEHLSRIAA
jgi:hypothetical protein